MKRIELLDFLNKRLDVDKFNDYAHNGLQVEGDINVGKLALATSASLSIIEQCVEQKYNSLLVHHGLFWNNQMSTLTGGLKKKVSLLLKNNINLFAYHLPLDAAEKFGNNYPVIKELFQVKPLPFFDIGWYGKLLNPLTAEKYKNLLNEYYNCDGLHIIPPNLNEINAIAVVSGQGTSYFKDLVKVKNYELFQNSNDKKPYHKIDAFISGEATEWVYSMALEHNISYSAVGHYRSETIGPKKLVNLLAEELKIEAIFLEENNPF